MDNFNEFAVEEVVKTTSRKWIPKFSNRYFTADGAQRAFVPLVKPDTLWFNTGTLCNITCKNCYIESSPQNDRLVYISATEVNSFLDQIETRKWPIETIGLTGGEPFMNFDIIEIVTNILSRGYQLLVLTNAMRPMMRPKIMASLLEIQKKYGKQLILRVSLDHYDERKARFHKGQGIISDSHPGAGVAFPEWF